ncbi:hypothetical protein K2X33_07250 [bacterium]|nr:hypothetical protein [bacterium]
MRQLRAWLAATVLFALSWSSALHSAQHNTKPATRYKSTPFFSEEDSSLKKAFDFDTVSAKEQALALETFHWLLEQGPFDPNVAVRNSIEKIIQYFGPQNKKLSAEKIELLKSLYQWLKDDGPYPTDLRGWSPPLLSPWQALVQAEKWIFDEKVQSENDLIALQTIERRFQREKRSAILPWLHNLLNNGDIKRIVNSNASTAHGNLPFQAARESEELSRLLALKALGHSTPEQSARSKTLQERLSGYGKKEIGLRFNLSEQFTDFSRTNEGQPLQGEAFHPKDADPKWKRDFLAKSLTDLGLLPSSLALAEKLIAQERNPQVAAINRFIAFAKLLKSPPPAGLGLSDDQINEKIKQYASRPLATDDELVRLNFLVHSVHTYAPDWVQGGGNKLLFEKLLSYAQEDEFNSMLVVVDHYLNAHIASLYDSKFALFKKTQPMDGTDPRDNADHVQNWRTFERLEQKDIPAAEVLQNKWYEEAAHHSPQFWRRPAKPLSNKELPSCNREAFELATRGLPPWGQTQEIKNALAIMCTADVLKAEAALITEIKRARERQQTFDNVTKLLNTVSEFLATLPEELNSRNLGSNCDESEIDMAVCLNQVTAIWRRSVNLLKRALLLLKALKSAEYVISQTDKENSPEAPIRELSAQLDQAVESLEVLAKFSKFSEDDYWAQSSAVALSQNSQTARPVLMAAGGSPAVSGTSVYHWAAPQGIPVVPAGMNGLAQLAMAQEALYHKANLALGTGYDKLRETHLKQFNNTPGQWAKQNAEIPARIKSNIAALKTDSGIITGATSHSLATIGNIQSLQNIALQDRQSLSDLGGYLSSLSPRTPEGFRDLRTAYLARQAAEIAFSNGSVEEGRGYSAASWILGRMAEGITDNKRLLIGLTPGIGFAQDLYETLTGKDIDGNNLDLLDRSFAVLGVISGGIGSKAKIPFKGLLRILESKNGAKVAGDLSKSLDIASDAAKTKQVSVAEKGWHRRFSVQSSRSAEDVNTIHFTGREPPFLVGSAVDEVRPVGQETFVRVYGGISQKEASWIMRRESIEGLSPAQLQKKYNLPNIPTDVVDVIVPPGTTIFRGKVGPNKYGDSKGAIQYNLRDTLPSENYVKPRPIKEL